MSHLESDQIPCVEVLTSVVFLIEDALDQAPNALALANHLNTCLACQAEVAHEQAVKAMMQEVLRRTCDEKAPEDLHSSIHDLLAQQLDGHSIDGNVSSVMTQFSMTEISIEIDEFGNVEHREVQIEQTHIAHFIDDDESGHH